MMWLRHFFFTSNQGKWRKKCNQGLEAIKKNYKRECIKLGNKPIFYKCVYILFVCL